MAASVVLDSEPLSRIALQDPAWLTTFEALMLVRATLIVPSVILAEVMTGKASDAAIWRVVNQLTTVDVNTRIAGRAGAIREKAQGARAKKRDLSVDAMVAATAENANASMLITCDVNDMTLLTADSGIRVVGL